jgi:hypothetical protein
MTNTPPGTHKELFIQGITSSGKEFRPSDWVERLCGVMACFKPPSMAFSNRMQYSPYVRPEQIGDLRCVVVDERLRDLEPMAMNFVLNFAKDNDLIVVEACSIPEHHEQTPQAQKGSDAQSPSNR